MSGFSFFAISTLRNNKRKRINKFDRIRAYIGTKISRPSDKKVSQRLLNTIKTRMQQQNRQSRRKTIIIFSIVGCILAVSMYYFLFVYQV